MISFPMAFFLTVWTILNKSCMDRCFNDDVPSDGLFCPLSLILSFLTVQIYVKTFE